MATEPVRTSKFVLIALGFQMLTFVSERWWPGSSALTIARTAWFAFIALWLGSQIRIGYRRRRPYWTRESWLRYLRFLIQPVAALALVLYISSFDFSANSKVFGAPQSRTRSVVALSLLAMMLLGVIGLLMTLYWLEKGEPSEQFTRTGWLQFKKLS